jgi:D-alanyl-D-alanine carboxypeptidase (penicillin-binding protein 5/6)
VLLAALVAALGAGLVDVPDSEAAASAPAPSPPDVDVASYVIADYDTGQILAEQNPHRALYPASTLKVLTADTLIPRLNPALDVTPKAADFAAEPDGSVVGMTAGVTYSVADLWRATFVESANDAVAELAHLSGGLDATVAAMQKEARSLGARDTTVVDADGYDQDGQLTSAYDLALFARAGLRIPAFRGYCDLRQTTFPAPNGATLTLTSHDPMVKSYPGMIGIKGGLTTKAGHTYVGAATRNGHTVIETLMLGGTDVFDQAARLMDWGFEADGKVTPAGTLSGATGPTGSGPGQNSTVSATSTPTPKATVTLQAAPTPTPTPTPAPMRTQASAPRSPKPIPEAPSRETPSRASSGPLTRVDAVGRAQASAPKWSGAAWMGAMAALAAVAIPVGAQGMHRRRKR